MAKQTQLRRGTTAEHSTFVGAVGEVTVDISKDVVVVHDGITSGGIPAAKQADITAANTVISGLAANVGLLRVDLNALDPGAAAAGQSQLRANIAAANVNIINLQSNAAVQAVAISGLTTDLAGANSAINTVQIAVGVINGQLSDLQSVDLAVNASVASLGALTSSNAAVQAQSIDALRANVTAANAAILVNTNRVAAANIELDNLRANITAANSVIVTLQSNAATQSGLIDALRANVTAANAAILVNTNRVAAANIELDNLRANITAANSTINSNHNSLLSNLATRTSEENQLRANITAANAAITTANADLKSYLDDRFTTLIGGAPAALDTLVEIAAALQNDPNTTTTILNSITSINANVTAANAAILVNTNRVAAANVSIAAVQNAVDAANSRVTAANVLIAIVNANVAAANVLNSSEISGVRANVTAANAEILSLRANSIAANSEISFNTNSVTAANAAIAALRANVTAANAAIAAIDFSALTATNANVTAANAAIAGVQANVTAANAAIAALRANVTAANTIIANISNTLSNAFGSTGNVNTGNVNLTGNVILSGAVAPTIRFVRSPDTSVTAGEIYGNIDFAGEDSSSGASGVRARISSEATNSVGAAAIKIYIAGSASAVAPELTVNTAGMYTDTVNSRNLTATEVFLPATATGGGIDAVTNLGTTILGYGTTYYTYTPDGSSAASETTVFSTFVMDPTVTTANVSLGAVSNTAKGAPLVNPAGTYYTNELEIWVTGTYVSDTNNPITVSRLRKRIIATVVQTSSTGNWSILDQQLAETVYNSDGTNFAAGAVSAGKVFLQANATLGYQDLYLRFDNRTSPAANARTRWTYSIISRSINGL